MISVFDDAEQLAQAAAERFVAAARAAVGVSGRFSVALAGGTTPRRVYKLLASDAYKNQLEWSKVHIFFGDERCVPPAHPDSNYRMARETLLARVAVPAANVHRIEGAGDAASGARRYEDELRAFFKGDEWPRFDLVLLGMGDDGHTASLFPHTHALAEEQAWVVANRVEKLRAFRITLTARAINHAARVVFMVAGAGKAARLAEVLHGARDPERLPAQLIRPLAGSLEWLVDRAAAESLPDADSSEETRATQN
ncbi:MAG TPA: 6-phosphogluconolactonase [Pyrinomonadaceae bacterium]|jgi:6-phosphogluconolactonase|nr:6-phosphogluconolactonase [Pyrinomonadaceae bacterium]